LLFHFKASADVIFQNGTLSAHKLGLPLSGCVTMGSLGPEGLSYSI
jgi:hypothetical protein